MGSLTDVPGIRVGHVHKTGDGWLTGVTVVLPPVGTVGSVDVQGGGPATHETDALDPTTLVRQVDAVVLAGGSAYGLASAVGAQRWCEENGRGFAVPGGVVPIVPAAAIFDLGRGGDFAARPTPEMGYEAAAAAAAQTEGHDVGRGNVGAGAGALIGRGQVKGGVGTASVTLDNGVVVGALAVVNALGLPVGGPSETQGDFNRLNQRDGTSDHLPLNTTIVVVATNAVLDVAECKRTAAASHAGIARALNPSHTLADGDTVFCLATGAVALDRADEAARQLSLVTLQSAAADVVRQAILDGVAHAEPVSTSAGDYGAYGGQMR
ncbi:peptidase S58 DmpA [Pseudarthrobacter chlorophenolicus A6]|uniref:Peptidase S58 DmpA n=1 Tax=Pseudarthrobacter chlorophenolicus (strain ATCC 700700 / DSM 12829 / CIP 107037 / JCM 12360 / KCTC 9906 / NCIMB 13794 / A6) TaxID=452863 RepID=B8HCX9_PSECP|nr:P1 family peptidase [Pseudarthrobacter chlorophenolicus]ACL40625.1 peptidase S58 DmpA [Pseudarthrobacter chlorophenolicus A6]SDQ78131.1 L-aminopeptidase/D-esterase [Pseudarthrobacter chlorophenolicus]